MSLYNHHAMRIRHKLNTQSGKKTAKLLTRMVAFCALAICCSPSFARTVREAMHSVEPAQRNTSFSSFLQEHGKECVVKESTFTAAKALNMGGDIWSVRCTNAHEYAIFIGGDANSTSWFLPCDNAQRISSFRCFEKNTKPIVLK